VFDGDDEDTTSQPFNAGFNSVCGSGEDDIDEGDDIVMWNGKAWHVECATEAGAEVRE
jgi:hypothetical protein